ncbi:MAG: hypothetical protein JW999_06350, partial [Methanotrichaceae archaeon]|nr:hypothetical protein [Methanotrichaceae archaeon]
MNWIKSQTSIMLIFLVACVFAQEDPLGPSSAAAMQDIRNTMGDDIFSPGQQDQKGNATPVITGKNLPGSIAAQQASQSKARLLSPTSTWSLNLLDSLDRVVALEMYQSNDVVFGKGTIAVGSSLEKATATGTITGNKLNLDILSDDLTLFRLYLTMNGKSLSGDYHGYSISVVPWKGIAMG